MRTTISHRFLMVLRSAPDFKLIIQDCNWLGLFSLIKDYDYPIIFASGITITSRLRLHSFCLIMITPRLRLFFLIDCDYEIIQLRLQFDCTNFIICMLVLFLFQMHPYMTFIFHNYLWTSNQLRLRNDAFCDLKWQIFHWLV